MGQRTKTSVQPAYSSRFEDRSNYYCSKLIRSATAGHFKESNLYY
ncbi:hypothetical protein X975_09451, partial [Stegodyphus mimosarum]